MLNYELDERISMRHTTIKISGQNIIIQIADDYSEEIHVLPRDEANAIGKTLVYASQPHRSGTEYEHTIRSKS